MAGFVASTYTYLWRASLDVAFAGIAEAGFAQVELLAAAPHVDAGDLGVAADQIGGACARTGLRVHSVVPSGVDVNLASPDPTMRRWSAGHFVTMGRLAAAVGARWLIIHPGRRHPLRPAPYQRYRQWVTDGVCAVLDALSGVEIGVLFENTPTGVLDTGEECARLAEAVGPDRIGVCYDVANGHMVEDAGAGLAATGRHLGLVHLSDTTRAAWAHSPVGAGEIDFAGVHAAVSARGYEGPFVLETLHDGDATAGFAADLATLHAAGWRWSGASAAGRRAGSKAASGL